MQFYAQRLLRQAVDQARAESGTAVVMDARSGELIAVADYPTFDANEDYHDQTEQLGSAAFADVYEPGSVEKVLTAAALVEEGAVTPRTRITVPEKIKSSDRMIGDYFDHGTIRLTMAGVIAKSSNVGTVIASRRGQGPRSSTTTCGPSAWATASGSRATPRSPACSPTGRTGSRWSATTSPSARAWRSPRCTWRRR